MWLGRAGVWLSLLALAAASGCCYCGTFAYDMKANDAWNALDRGLHGGPTSVDAEQTGVSIQLPVLFDSKLTQTFRPGPSAGPDQVLPERVQPPGMNLPGLRFTCLMHYADSQNRPMPVSCYLAVLAKGGAERTKVKQQLLAAAKKTNPEAAWETVTLEGSALPTERLSFTSTQPFLQQFTHNASEAVEAEGRLDLYLVAGEHANVLVGWRGPVDVAKKVSLFEAAEASVATIKSEKPAGVLPTTPTDSPPTETQNYVQAPDTNVELIPPAGYAPAPLIFGFQKSGTNATIAVAQQANPFSALVNSYSPDALKPYDINVLESEEVTIGDGPGLLLFLQKPDQTYWNLVFGDDSGSHVVTATLADPNDAAEKQALKAALLTVRTKK
jgi:hypothetical protein